MGWKSKGLKEDRASENIHILLFEEVIILSFVAFFHHRF